MQIALRKNIDGSPSESKRDCRKLSSNKGPRTTAIKNGAAGTLSLSMAKPNSPNMIMTKISNMLLLTA
jgi:hypothetical protein